MNVLTIFRGYDFSIPFSTDNEAIDLTNAGCRLFNPSTRTRVEATVTDDAEQEGFKVMFLPASVTAQMPLGAYNIEVYDKSDGTTLYHCEPFAMVSISSGSDYVNIVPEDESESE